MDSSWREVCLQKMRILTGFREPTYLLFNVFFRYFQWNRRYRFKWKLSISLDLDFLHVAFYWQKNSNWWLFILALFFPIFFIYSFPSIHSFRLDRFSFSCSMISHRTIEYIFIIQNVYLWFDELWDKDVKWKRKQNCWFCECLKKSEAPNAIYGRE